MELHLLRLVGSSLGVLKLKELKALTRQDMVDGGRILFFPPLQEEGERWGKKLARGATTENHSQNCLERHTVGHRKPGPECLSPSSSAQSWQNIHLLHQQVVLMQEFIPPCTNTHVHTAHFQM